TGEFVVPSATTIVHEHLRVPEAKFARVLSSVAAAAVEIPGLHAEQPRVSAKAHEPATIELSPIEPGMLASGMIVAEPHSLESTIDVSNALASQSAEPHA